MTDNEFDKRLREICDGIEETPDSCLWDGIQSSLLKRRRRVIFRRAGVSAAAVAAVSLLVLTLTRLNPEARDIVTVRNTEGEPPVVADVISLPPSPTVEVVQSVSPSVRTEPVAEEKVESVPEIPVEQETVEEMKEVPVARPSEPESVAEVPEVAVPGEAATQPEIADVYDGDEERIRDRGSFALSASSDLYPVTGAGKSTDAVHAVRATDQNSDEIITPVTGYTPQHSFPISVGLGLQYSFLKGRLSVGTGVYYTYLQSKYVAFVNDANQNGDVYNAVVTVASVKQQLHYIGIPLTLSYNIVNRPKILFYAFLGGMLEKGVNVRYDITDENGYKHSISETVPGVQWSLNGGVGVEYRFIKWMGIYLDPRVSYFFNCGQPFTARTEQPFQVDINLGFRFHL